MREKYERKRGTGHRKDKRIEKKGERRKEKERK